MSCIACIDSCTFNHLCIPGMNLTEESFPRTFQFGNSTAKNPQLNLRKWNWAAIIYKALQVISVWNPKSNCSQEHLLSSLDAGFTHIFSPWFWKALSVVAKDSHLNSAQTFLLLQLENANITSQLCTNYSLLFRSSSRLWAQLHSSTPFSPWPAQQVKIW